MNDSNAREALRRLLEGFTPRDDEGEIWRQDSVGIQVDRGQLPVPRLVLFLLTHVIVDLGRDDKTAWQVPSEFRGHRITIASQKFGLQVYVIPAPGSEETAEAVVGTVHRM